MKTVNILISLHINKLHSDFEAQLYVLNSTFIILCSRSRLDFFLIGDGLDFDSCLLGKKTFDTFFSFFGKPRYVRSLKSSKRKAPREKERK